MAAAEIDRTAPILMGPGAGLGVTEIRHRIRSELARELHDQVAQNLTAMLIQLHVYARANTDRPDVMDQFRSIHTSAREVLNNTRQMLCELRGQPRLTQELVQSLEGDLLARYREVTGVRTTLWVSRSWPHILPPETCIHVYRIIQEAITNAHKHGGATSVHVALRARRSGHLVVTIRDEGRGFDQATQPRLLGVGILGMKERAALLGGELRIRSKPAKGTCVTATVPLEATLWRATAAKFAS